MDWLSDMEFVSGFAEGNHSMGHCRMADVSAVGKCIISYITTTVTEGLFCGKYHCTVDFHSLLYHREKV
jgi:hypothetical protein